MMDSPENVSETTDTEQDVLTYLHAALTPLATDDPMAEAGRKVLLADFIEMLEHEDGSRSGEDIENVHQMRVATRRMRSALRLFEPYYKQKTVRPFTDSLRTLARRLGDVRDLDVLIEDVQKVQGKVSEDGQAALQTIIDHFDAKRQKARAKLVKYLDSGAYRRFVDDFTAFLTKRGAGAVSVDESSITPYQMRHAVPALLQDYLGMVRAYDTVIPAVSRTDETLELPDMATLHQLRIEFKRLRYALYFFREVLGASGKAFIDEIKTMQDLLGRLNDTYVAEEHLNDFVAEGLDESLIEAYLNELMAEREALENSLPSAWRRFNTRNVMSKFSEALLMLR